jgi:hypothetical protein
MSHSVLRRLVLASMLTFAGIASAAVGTPGKQNYADYALPPVDSFTAFTFHSWTPVSDNQLVVWTQFNEAYLVTVWKSCLDLKFAWNIGIQRTLNSVTKFDKVLVGNDRCPIESIQPIDLKRMKTDREAAR